jgi:hypothetical protein
MTQKAGIKVQFPSSCYEKPYMRVPEAEAVAPVLNIILRLYDDQDLYNEYVARAHHVGCTFV